MRDGPPQRGMRGGMRGGMRDMGGDDRYGDDEY